MARPAVSVNGPRRRRSARSEAASGADALFGAVFERDLIQTGPWAFRYLQSSPLLARVAPAPMSPAEQHKLDGEQADTMVDVLWAVLDGLGLTEEQHDRGLDLAIKALQEAAGPGWEPL
jgi:hypothetical protein